MIWKGKMKTYHIAFWNLENLFDIDNDPNMLDPFLVKWIQ